MGAIEKLALAFYSFLFRKHLLSANFVPVQSWTLGILLPPPRNIQYCKGDSCLCSNLSTVGKRGSGGKSSYNVWLKLNASAQGLDFTPKALGSREKF